MIVAKEEYCSNCHKMHINYIDGCPNKNHIRAFKLLRKLKDGTLSPLFINQKARLPLDTWMAAESHPTKGFAYRPGWHCTLYPTAPHLSTKNRVWCEVEVEDFKVFSRPVNQGGVWILANNMKIIKEL